MIGSNVTKQLNANCSTPHSPTGGISYRQIRSEYQKHDPGLEEILVDHYAKLISPLFTKFLIKTGISPNGVTVLMMIAGIAGAVLFAIPSIACKAFGLIFIHAWFVLDCSDGEVARITGTFSKFGTEIDYTAHVINHPLFNLAFICSLMSLGRYNAQVLYLTAILCISAELVLRNLIGFRYMYELKMGKVVKSNAKGGTLKMVTIHLINFFTLYPNLALIFPVLYIVDRYIGTSFAIYYILIHTSISILLAGRSSYRWVKTIAVI